MTSPKLIAIKHHLHHVTSPAMLILIRGFVAVAAGSLLGRILSAVAGILLVRYFDGPALYGQYATLVTTLTLMSNLLGLGFDTWLLREGGRDPSLLSFNARRLLVLKFGAASILIGALVVAWNQSDLSWLVIIGMLGIIAENYLNTGYVMFHALSRNGVVAVLQSLDALLAVVLILLLMNWSPQVATLVVGQSIVSGTVLIIAAILLANHWRGAWRPLRLGQLIRSAGFFVLADVLANIYSQAQIAILALFTSDVDVGIFRSAINLITMSFLVPMAMFNVSLPLLSRQNIERRQRYHIIFGIFGLATCYGIIALLGFWWFGADLLRLIYGNKYEAVIPLLTPLSVVPLFKSLSFVAVAIMLALSAQRLRVVMQSIVVILSLLLGLIIIPTFGVTGATSAYIAVELALCVFYWIGALYTLHKTRI
ncbi:lipopolysaccharide biosynthesis protein [Chloroflexus sp.]|uniref:lipopolysaccharide biosynthesis protein n=1 Tax=Chloroflexus sp. TaxID=1904827 RepID=UPI002ADE7459|nr:lipopolysaccharide biosynthesis protein [Chloroflexus sp.]